MEQAQMNVMEEKAKQLGAKNAAVVLVENIRFAKEFRKMCESNACGMYGKCWTCPPDVGEIDTLIQQAKQYRFALVYQIVGELEDSYDFEGMMQTGEQMNQLTQAIREKMADIFGKNALHLGAGGCRICKKCAKSEQKPCVFPKRALASLEAFGIDVSQLAQQAGMNYINGENTVTYFGAVLFGIKGESKCL